MLGGGVLPQQPLRTQKNQGTCKVGRVTLGVNSQVSPDHTDFEMSVDRLSGSEQPEGDGLGGKQGELRN